MDTDSLRLQPLGGRSRVLSFAVFGYDALKMLYMVIERFKNKDGEAVYRRLRERGRMMPDGLHYVNSWVEPSFNRCFQLMECEDPALFAQWTPHWADLMEFEIIPVMTSQEARE